MSHVANPSLAPQGQLNLEIAEKRMGALLKVRDRFKKEQPFKGLTIGLSLHVTTDTGILVRTLVAGGARAATTGCNPLSTQHDIADALAMRKKVFMWGYKGKTKEDYYTFLSAVMDVGPEITIEGGLDLVT